MSKICQAIRGRLVIRFRYDGGGYRTAEPHCYGTSTAGNEVLRAFQTGGASVSGQPVGWKMFDVSKMSSISLTNSSFIGSRPGYNPNDRNMISIHCRL